MYFCYCQCKRKKWFEIIVYFRNMRYSATLGSIIAGCNCVCFANAQILNRCMDLLMAKIGWIWLDYPTIINFKRINWFQFILKKKSWKLSTPKSNVGKPPFERYVWCWVWWQSVSRFLVWFNHLFSHFCNFNSNFKNA